MVRKRRIDHKRYLPMVIDYLARSLAKCNKKSVGVRDVTRLLSKMESAPQANVPTLLGLF